MKKLQKIRQLSARRAREYVVLQRRIDSIPARAELAQYQRRFIELYEQSTQREEEEERWCVCVCVNVCVCVCVCECHPSLYI